MALRLWTGLLAAWLVVLPSVKCIGLKAPVKIKCIFIHRTNVTCNWEPGDSQATSYTLHVQQITNSPTEPLNCHTSNTSCAVDLRPQELSVNFNFCVSVTAHSRHGDVTSDLRCQYGVEEICLHPVTLNSVTAVEAKPQCLNLSWKKDRTLFLISTNEIKDGKLESQIVFQEDGQPDERLSNVTVTKQSFVACVFRPDTWYSVKLRHRYKTGSSLWSPWSNDHRGKTGEDAPSSAPMFWRRVIHQHSYRLTSLLWKHLPPALANGRVRSYDVTCRDENAEVLADEGNCSRLNSSHSSCVLKLPLGPCSCSITANTSAGTSPKASIWLSDAHEKEPPPPRLLSVTAVDDRSLGLKWSRPSAAAASLSGFIVEWFVVTQKNDSLLYWERVNSSTTALNITEGVEPFQRYAVSVTALYGKEGAGQSETQFVYTRQGAPSAGPEVQMQTSGHHVTLSWSLPVEKRHGFIQNYILFYETANKTSKLVLPGTAERRTLRLSPGHFVFWIQASTEAGPGPSGPVTSANIGPEEVSVVVYVLVPIGVISLLLIVTVCVAGSKTVKGKLCQKIPDPSHSSMATWSPKTTTGMMLTKPDIRYSSPVLLGNTEAEAYESDQDGEETCSHSSAPTRCYNPFKCDSKHQTCARTSNVADADSSSCPVIYSVAVMASSSGQQHRSYPDVKQYGPPRDGEGADVPLYKMQPPNIASQLHHFHLNHFESFAQTEPVQQNSSFSCLPFPGLLLVDFMDLPQSSMECDPYLPV